MLKGFLNSNPYFWDYGFIFIHVYALGQTIPSAMEFQHSANFLQGKCFCNNKVNYHVDVQTNNSQILTNVFRICFYF